MDYLSRVQLPDGEFQTLVFPTADLNGPSQPDSTNFTTCLICYSLGFSRSAKAAETIGRALRFLRANLEPPAFLRYWTPKSRLRRYMPPDVDDTSCAAIVLRRGGFRVPNIRSLLLANRARNGLFYTWMLPPPLSRIPYARVVRLLRRLIFPASHFFFWRRTTADPDDIDAVVNANVLAWLGDGEFARPVIEHLKNVLEEGREASCDKWYLDPYSVYYFVSRAHLEGVAGLHVARSAIAARILPVADGDPEALNELQLAQAACALMSFELWGAALERLVTVLLSRQREDGSWPVQPAYYGSPNYFWGSSELTTAVAVEAISRYALLAGTPQPSAKSGERAPPERSEDEAHI